MRGIPWLLVVILIGPTSVMGADSPDSIVFRWEPPLRAFSQADSLRVAERFGLIRSASGLTIYRVGGWRPKCESTTFPQHQVVDCHPVLAATEAPSRAWRDSVTAMLTAKSALSASLPGNLCLCEDDFILQFAGPEEATNVWIYSSCGRLTLPGIGWFDLRIPLATALAALFPSTKTENLSEVEYYDEPPRLIARPEMPSRLRVSRGGAADTIQFDARIGKDGRVVELRRKGTAPAFESEAAELVSRYVYTPALLRKRPVAAWITVQIPVRKH